MHRAIISLFLALPVLGILASAISDNYISDSLFESTILAAHNAFRAAHSVPALNWDSTLASFGASHASACDFKHSGGPYGENIAAGYTDTAATVNAWGNERNQYVYDPPSGFTKATGHFTAVVWKKTTAVGCGRAACNGANGTPGYFVVCEYSPAGNIVGQSNRYFSENVFPPNAALGESSSVDPSSAPSPTTTPISLQLPTHKNADPPTQSAILTFTSATNPESTHVALSTIVVTVTRTRTRIPLSFATSTQTRKHHRPIASSTST